MLATTRLVLLATCLSAAALNAAPNSPRLDRSKMPDRVEMEDGRVFQGLILKNSPKYVILQTAEGEVRIPKDGIRRIHDEIDAELIFPDLTGRGRLPYWRAMVTDLRNHDDIRSLQQIPATNIDRGVLRNIPYLSFRINRQSELNVYGNPQDPVAVEFGMLGRRKDSPKYQQIVREFLAGHLHSREEIGALYSLDLKNGGEKKVGNLVFRITTPRDNDSYGGWWILVYDSKRIDRARVSDAQYAALTKPFEEVNRRDGSLRVRNRQEQDNWLATMMQDFTGQVPQFRGFYRDREGKFRLITFSDES